MTEEEALEVSKIYSVCGLIRPGVGLMLERPFRAPHHSISPAALVGGGAGEPRPGEATLAHRGVLFLDEAAEFRRDALEALREPIESGLVRLVRSGGGLAFPARFMLVLGANPCPCGNLGDPVKPCTCTSRALASYRGRLSGPILDRIDLHVEVKRLAFGELGAGGGRRSDEMRERVVQARARAGERLRRYGLTCNAEMGRQHLSALVRLSARCELMLAVAFERLGLSARGYDRILKVARTIADLDGSDEVGEAHLAEAIQYRSLDRVSSYG